MAYPEGIPPSAYSQVYSEGLQARPQHEEKIVHDANPSRPWQAPSKDSNPDGRRRNKICGLGVPVFWIVIAILVLLLAAGIGTGIGLGLAAKNDCPLPTLCSSQGAATTTITSPSSSATTPLTDYIEPVKATNVQSLDLDPDCPDRDASTYSSLTNERYTIRCGKDVPASNNRRGTYNILAVRAFSMNDCIEACSSWNWYGGNETDACVGVVLNRNMKDYINDYYGNCWLKTGRETVDMSELESIAAILEE